MPHVVHDDYINNNLLPKKYIIILFPFRWKRGKKWPGSVQVVSPDKRHVFIHPSSVIAGSTRAKQPMRVVGGNWMVYWLKQKTSEVYLFEVTIVYTLPLLFFGELKVCCEYL